MSAADLPKPPDMARIERLAALLIAANACDMELTTEHAALFLDQKPEQFPKLARRPGFPKPRRDGKHLKWSSAALKEWRKSA